jgi:hypothetical protein
MGLCGPLFVACQKHKDEVIPAEEIPAKEAEPPAPTVETPAATPGYFVISSIQRTTTPGGRTTAGETIRFDLGALKASKEFLFMIANGGDEAIFDVTLTTDKPAFQIFPGKIQLVPGRKGSAIIPLLTVGVTHGVNLNGIGNAPTLPKGENTAIITMKGKTVSGKDTVAVQGEFTVAVDAKVIDAKILSGESEVAPVTFWGSLRWMVEPARTVKLVNTGSVAIQATINYMKTPMLTNGYPGQATYVENEVALQPDESKDISSSISKPEGYYMEEGINYFYTGMTSIKIKDQGVVYNVNGFTLVSK